MAKKKTVTVRKTQSEDWQELCTRYKEMYECEKQAREFYERQSKNTRELCDHVIFWKNGVANDRELNDAIKMYAARSNALGIRVRLPRDLD